MRDLRLAIGAISIVVMLLAYPRSKKQQRVIEISDQMKSTNGFVDDQKKPIAVCEIIQESKHEVEKEEIKEEKKRIVGTGNLSDMFYGYDRHMGMKEARKNSEVRRNSFRDENGEVIKEDDPRKHFRGNIERIIAMSKEEVDLERGKRYIKNVQEVLSHSTKQNA